MNKPESTFPRVGEIHFCDTHVAIWEEIPDGVERETVFCGVQAAFEKLLDHLRRRGFTVEPDRKVDKLIRRWYWLGRKGSLGFHAETGGRTAKVEFFQNVARGKDPNPNGGRCDFGKFQRMPRDLRLRCAVEMIQLIRAMQALGYAFGSRSDLYEPLPRAVLRKAENRTREGLSPLEQFNHDREPRERLDAWQTADELDQKAQSYDRKDQDGKLLCNGDVRYFYDYDGRIARGQVFYAGGNCWSVFLADGTWFARPGNYKLFSTDRPDLLPRREVKEPQISRVSRELQKARAARDSVLKQFVGKDGQVLAAPLAARVTVLEKVLARLTAGERGYYVLSLKHSKVDEEGLTFWRPNASGYVWAGSRRIRPPPLFWPVFVLVVARLAAFYVAEEVKLFPASRGLSQGRRCRCGRLGARAGSGHEAGALRGLTAAREQTEPPSAPGELAGRLLRLGVRQGLRNGLSNGFNFKLTGDCVVKLFNAPRSGHDSNGHSRRYARSPDDAPQVVPGVIEGARGPVVFNALTEREHKPAHASNHVTHRGVVALNVRRRSIAKVRGPVYDLFRNEGVTGRLIPVIVVPAPLTGVVLDGLRIVDGAPEVRAHRGDVGGEAVGHDIRHKYQARAEILDEGIRRCLIPAADVPRDDEARCLVHGAEHVGFPRAGAVLRRDARLLDGDVRPTLVGEDFGAGQVPGQAIVEPLGSFAERERQLANGLAVDPGESATVRVADAWTVARPGVQAPSRCKRSGAFSSRNAYRIAQVNVFRREKRRPIGHELSALANDGEVRS